MVQHIVTFDGMILVARGELPAVAHTTREWMETHPEASILAFEEATGRQIEVDLQGSVAEVVRRHATRAAAAVTNLGPGRPKLGVVGREVTLLPRHWDWLGTQPGGASIALRKLVEQGMKTGREADTLRQRQENAYRFMSAIAGNLPGYEEAIRALFAGDAEAMEACMKTWSADVRSYALELAFAGGDSDAA